jgi:hypothetical protein
MNTKDGSPISKLVNSQHVDRLHRKGHGPTVENKGGRMDILSGRKT